MEKEREKARSTIIIFYTQELQIYDRCITDHRLAAPVSFFASIC